jgi:molecular chaperone GrpE (heat shock protein)
MKPSSDLDKLTRNMAQRLTGAAADPSNCPEPYILFLGAGCSLAAGVPSIDEIAEKELSQRVGSGSSLPAPPYDPLDKATSLKRFYKWLEPMSAGHVFRLFQAHYANTPVPLFYQDLALLIKSRYFNRILTTNFDTLLEQALSGAGLVPDVDFQVTNFGFTSRPSETPRSRATDYDSSPDRAQEPVSIVKLHGDLAEGQLMITPSQIEESLKSRRLAAKQELRGDMVMVGYKFESPLLNRWLSSYQKRELWWVSSDKPTEQDDIQSWGEDIASIDGEVGKPEEFFSQLALRLLRLPVLQSQRQTADSSLEGFLGASAEPAEVLLPEDDEVLAEDLRGQIRRVQASLYSLEQKASPDDRPASLQAQIDYQKQQIVLLEDKLRSLSTSKPQLLQLLESLTNNLQVALDDPKIELISGATVSFLRNQYEAVKEQYSAGVPNQQIISAAVGAAAILAERLYVELGEQVVKREDVRSLASFVPTTATRGIK